MSSTRTVTEGRDTVTRLKAWPKPILDKNGKPKGSDRMAAAHAAMAAKRSAVKQAKA